MSGFFFLTSIFQIFVLWLHCFSLKKRKDRTRKHYCTTTVVHPVNEPNPPPLSSSQVQEQGTYDLLAPLALLFYSTVLCVSTKVGPGGWGREKREWVPTGDGCQPSDGFSNSMWMPLCLACLGGHPWRNCCHICSQATKDILLRDFMSTSICTPTVSFTLCNQPLDLPDWWHQMIPCTLSQSTSKNRHMLLERIMW